MSIVMIPSNILTMMPLLISAALFLCLEFKKMLDANPSTPVLSIGSVQNYITKGAKVDI